jgi:hypothetical protein
VPAPPPRLLRRRRALAAAALAGCLGLGAAACAADPPGRDELARSLASSGLPEDVAGCAADALHDHLSTQELRDIAERGGGGAPVDDPERTDDAMDQVRTALAECRTKLEPTTTTAVPPTVPIDDGSTTTLVGEG